MNESTEREAFEAHMRGQNACTHFGRHPNEGAYRTITVERAWQLWQAARASQSAPTDEEAEGARQVVEVYDKLHAGKVGQHWLWAVIEQIAAGVPEDEALLAFGYYEKQPPCHHRPACECCAEDRALAQEGAP